ncbi:MAG: hypothetical protein JWN04_4430, partial [Myxococcaceae bacterium]|nr:hypothetical protein [Myxococcaceae bacterium]
MNAFRMKKGRARLTRIATCCLALSLTGACQDQPQEAGPERPLARSAAELRSSPSQLREFIARQAGGLDKLKVPIDNDSIPLPPEDPSRPGRYKTTAAKS